VNGRGVLDDRPPMARLVKRCIDCLGAAAGLVLLGPLMLVIAAAVRLWDGPPVLFRHVRAGRREKPFVMLKFRTMNEARDAEGQLLPDADRITRLGRWLRSTSVDELPELINVLRGDMSLVGPRPLLQEYSRYYTSEQAQRLNVRPGITGWAQINGRNGVSWERRFELDLWYVRHWSLGLDLQILGLTAWRVLRRQGVSAEGHATMPRFGGSAEA
jgi:sugar transferase EpsL